MTERLAGLEIGPEQVAEAFALTDEVVAQFPGRKAGSAACHGAGQRVKTEFEKFCDAGTVKAELCDIHPESFVKFVPGLVVLYYACVLLLVLIPALAWVSFVGLASGLFVFYGQTVMHWPLMDPFFPKKQGYNVYGSIEPSGQVKQQIIVSAHHDAAYVFRLRELLPKWYARLRLAGGLLLIAAVLVSLTTAILLAFGLSMPRWSALALLILGVFILPFLFFLSNKVSPAAGDDMMAVAVIASIGKLFGQAKKEGANPLEHTRLILLSFDAEECGLRGSRAWVKRHLAELKATKTYAFNMDPMYKFKYLEFYEADLGKRVKLSREMAQECVDIAAGLGYHAYIAPPRRGAATDASSFGAAGIEATNLHGMSSKEKDLAGWVYHTRNDVSQHIDPDLVEAALKIIREYVLRKDAQVSN